MAEVDGLVACWFRSELATSGVYALGVFGVTFSSEARTKPSEEEVEDMGKGEE